MTTPRATRSSLLASDIYSQVVVPADFSDFAWASVSLATAVAGAFDVDCRVVHVDSVSARRNSPCRYLTLIAGPHRHRVDVEVASARTPAEGIVRLLDDNDDALLVMSSHGRSAAAEPALGSVSDEVLRHWRGHALLTGPHYQPAAPSVSRMVVPIPVSAQLSFVLPSDVRVWADRLGVGVEVLAVSDDVDAILRNANDRVGTLLVMSSRLRPMTSQLLLGDVAKAVLRNATGPILFRHE